MLKLVPFVLPLGLDTLAVAAALGAAGLPRATHRRVSLLLATFEAAMPIAGLLLGRVLGSAIGGVADLVAVVLLAVVGGWMIVDADDDEGERAAQLARGAIVATVALGISISLDELAVGFTIGLLRLNLWAAVALIAAQAFLLAELGLRVGSRLNERLRESAERFAGAALLGLAAFFLVEHLTS